MTINVKFLSKQQIEREAQSLLEAYYHKQGKPIQIPVPVDEILEIHLGLSLNFDDLGSRLGIPNAKVLGALWVDQREVFIDQSLDPCEHPEMEGRCNFSIGHETGHWCLHRYYVANADAQAAMSADSEPQPTIICRVSRAKERIEWQADYFSSCFLMPRQSVLDAWSKRIGSLKPFVYANIANQNRARRPVHGGMKPVGMILRNFIDKTYEPYAYAFETIAREFAPMFRVSIQAMRIRLENLGLLLVDHPVEQNRSANY